MTQLIQKTFHASSLEEIDKLVNDFGKKYEIRATHDHVGYDANGNPVCYDYVVFYVPEEQQKKEEKEGEEMDCPGCGVKIKKHFKFHIKCGWEKK